MDENKSTDTFVARRGGPSGFPFPSLPPPTPVSPMFSGVGDSSSQGSTDIRTPCLHFQYALRFELVKIYVLPDI